MVDPTNPFYFAHLAVWGLGYLLMIGFAIKPAFMVRLLSFGTCDMSGVPQWALQFTRTLSICGVVVGPALLIVGLVLRRL